jgi:hypothetical protein
MSDDSKAPDSMASDTQADPSSTHAVPAPSGPTADATLYAIGYEAADPSLQSAYWSETELAADAPPRSPR